MAQVRFIPLHQLTWEKLSKIGQNRLFRSAYFWLIFIPLVVKLFSSTNSLMQFNIFGEQIALNFALPFSWKVFFFTAVTFSIGNLIYSIWCPGLIAEFKNYTEFDGHGHSVSRIVNDSVAILLKWKKAFALQPRITPQSAHILFQLHFFDHQRNSFPLTANTLDLMINELTTKVYDIPNTREAFWRLYRIYDHAYIVARGAVAFFYFVGLLLTAYLVCQNIATVIRFVLNE